MMWVIKFSAVVYFAEKIEWKRCFYLYMLNMLWALRKIVHMSWTAVVIQLGSWSTTSNTQ